MAASTVPGNWDIWACVGDVIYDKNTLCSLCRVNTSYNELFSRYLYAYMTFLGSDRVDAWFWTSSHPHVRLNLLLENPRLIYVHTLVIDHTLNSRPHFYWQRGEDLGTKIVNDSITQLFKRLPNLISFSFLGSEGLALLSGGTLRTLHRACPKLKSFAQNIEPSFIYCREWQTSPTAPCLPRLTPPELGLIWNGFNIDDLDFVARLKVLVLHGIQGNLSTWQEKLAKALAETRQLEVLSLGISQAQIQESRSPRHKSERHLFFHNLCHEYAKLGQEQLCLSTIDLRHPITLVHGACQSDLDGIQYLRKLTNLDCLEKLGFYAGTTSFWMRLGAQSLHNITLGPPFSPWHPWTAITPQNMPRLRVLTVSEMDDRDGWQKIFGIVVEAFRGKLDVRFEVGGFTDPRNKSLETIFYEPQMTPLGLPVIPQRLKILGVPWINIFQPMDRLPFWLSLTTLGCSIPHLKEFAPLVRLLCILPHLTELWLSIWDNICPPFQKFTGRRNLLLGESEAMTRRLAHEVKSLRYLRLNESAFRIHRNRDDGPGLTIKLYPLSRWEDEATCLDIFHSPFNMHMDHLIFSRRYWPMNRLS